MASYITSVSVDNAWGGKVSQQLEFLSVDDARKALLISTLSSKHQVDFNVPHVPFSAKLFDFEPEKLVTVLYGANGSGKTTVMKMMNGLTKMLDPLLKEHMNRVDRGATADDMRHWQQGTIPPSFQHPQHPQKIRMIDFAGNPVVDSICSSLRRSNNAKGWAIEDAESSIPWGSNFRMSLHGVCETLDFFDLDDETNLQATADSTFEISITPLEGVAYETEGLIRDNTKMIENFEGAFFSLRFEVKSFLGSLETELGEHHDGPFMQIKAGDEVPVVLETAFDLPILVHPSGGVLVLGRTIKDLRLSHPSNPRFDGIEEWTRNTDGVDGVKLLEYAKHRNDTDFESYFSDISNQPPSGEEDDCSFSRHMIHAIWSGFSSDFFISPFEAPKLKGGESLRLPSLLEKSHFVKWNEKIEETDNSELPFERAVDECRPNDFMPLIKSLDTEYIFPSMHEPETIARPKPGSDRFSSLFVAEKPAAYIHAMLLLNPPKNAWEGFMEAFAPGLMVSNGVENMYNAVMKIKQLVKRNRGGRYHNGPTIGKGEFYAFNRAEEANFPSFEHLKGKFSEHYAAKGHSEIESAMAAEMEIKQLIHNTLEQIWFYDLEAHAISSRFARMNAILEQHLGISVLHDASGFSREKLYTNPDMNRKIHSWTKPNTKFEQLSSGMCNFLNLIMALGDSSPRGPIFIDEPEISLHIDWQYALKDIATELADFTKRQVIFSTHSPDLIMNFGDRSLPFVAESEHDGA